jgi:hypothetical protein
VILNASIRQLGGLFQIVATMNHTGAEQGRDFQPVRSSGWFRSRLFEYMEIKEAARRRRFSGKSKEQKMFGTPCQVR